jgi:3-oxoacyl-[acyl-carrier-protein] synthase II
MKRRVAITGLGVVAPNGIGTTSFASALLSGQSGLRQVSPDESAVPCRVVARVRDFDAPTVLGPRSVKSLKAMSRVSQFAVVCAKMALEDAGLDVPELDPRRTGLCYGTTTGKPDFEEDAARFREGGPSAVDPAAWSEFSPHAPAGHIAREFGFAGAIATWSSGCCTGLKVLEWGGDQIASGRLDTVLVGTADSLLSPLILAAFTAGKLLSAQSDPTKASRPYDLYRDGLVPGEAAGAVVLESFDAAVDRNARVYAEYLGAGSAVDRKELGRRDDNGHGLARAIEAALDDARLGPERIDCINAHGLSHPVFDLDETRAFKAALGKAAYNIPITSIKSMTGASFAADGILQVVSSCLMLERDAIPPIPHLKTRDPACDLDYVTERARIARVRHILTNTRALGGTNAVVIIGRVDSRR